MPLVLQRNTGSRPEDAHLMRMRNEAAARHRSSRLTYDTKAAATIEYKQKANYERSFKRPVLPQPKIEAGYSTPEWDAARAAWLVYAIEDTSKWMAWDAFKEEWVDISDYDKSCSTPSSEGSKSGSGNVSASSTGLQERSDTTSAKPKFTFKAVALTVMKMLALRGQNPES